MKLRIRAVLVFIAFVDAPRAGAEARVQQALDSSCEVA